MKRSVRVHVIADMRLPLRALACCAALLVFSGIPLSAAGPALPVTRLVRIIDDRYNSFSTLQADFVEVYTLGLERRNESGVLYLKKPGKMRWDYGAPERKLFLVDGHNAWLYMNGDDQVERTPIKNYSDIRTPLRYLLGHLTLERELTDLSYGGLDPLQKDDVVIRGVPRAMREQFREVLLEISPNYDINRIVIRGTDGSETDFRLSHLALNSKLPARLFQFVPTAGMRVVSGAIAGSEGDHSSRQ